LLWSVGWTSKDEGNLDVVQSSKKVICKHGCGDNTSVRRKQASNGELQSQKISSWLDLDYLMLANREICATM
jgi:hypothetical protein